MEKTMARAFYTNEEKTKHMAMWKESGLNRKEYAASNGINEGTFYKWLERKHENPETGTGKNFVEIRQDGVPIEETIKVRMRGIEIEVPPSAFETVIKILVAI